MTKIYLSLSRYLTVLLMLITTVAWSQSRTVTGKVTSSDDGSALPGVNVVEKGTNNGTATDADGSYSINVGDNATLVFTFVGYSSQEVSVTGRSSIDVTLNADVTALSEIVVIGYGEVQRRDVTGAVASVKSEDFNRGVIASPELLIQGKTAGVQVTTASGEPGAGVNIRIRGTSSVRGGNNPLFVIDGIPVSGEDVSAGGADIGRGSAPSKNPLNFLNPNDIESIDILKDASATAIYGSRGANGVVLITTKGGRGKKRSLEYSTTLSLSSMANKLDLLRAGEFLDAAEDLGADRTTLDEGFDTDWQDEISRVSFSHRHDLGFSNSYKTGNYRVSLSYDDQQGVIRNSSMERITGRVNTSNRFLNDKLTFATNLTFSRVNDEAAMITNNAGFEGSLLGTAYMANPTWDPNPDVQLSSSNANPNSLLKYYKDDTRTNRMLLNFSLDYNITKDLSFKVNTGLDRSDSERGQAFSRLLNLSNGVTGNGRGSILEIETASDLLETYFTYNKTVGRGQLNAVLGYSYQEFERNGFTTIGFGFQTDDMDQMVDDLESARDRIQGAITQSYQQFGYDADAFFINQLFPTNSTINLTNRPTNINITAVTGDAFDYTDELQSFFGRVNYNLAEKYIFTATFRADGSTKFGSNNVYGFFPSGAFAWRLSEEDFIPEAIDDMKLRVGYGVTGNQEIGHNLHQQRQRYSGIGPDNGGNVNVPGINNVTYANPDLKWEETAQLNFGLDFGFASGKLSGSIDYYSKKTTNLLMQVYQAQPSPTEFSWRNLDADVFNRGIEFTLNYFAIDNEASNLNFGFNIAYNTNEVENLGGVIANTGEINGQGLSGAFAQRIANGQPLFSFFLREFAGFDEDGQSVYPNGDFQQFLDKSALPTINLGFNVNYRYKKWDAGIFFAGQFGHYIYNNTANAFFTAGSLANGRNVTQDVVGNGESPGNAPEVSTRFLEKGDFLRLQNLNLGYNFDLGNDSFIKKLRASFTGQNLLLFTNYSGLDPEVNTNKQLNGVPSLGIDYGAYPKARVFTLGVSATF